MLWLHWCGAALALVATTTARAPSQPYMLARPLSSKKRSHRNKKVIQPHKGFAPPPKNRGNPLQDDQYKQLAQWLTDQGANLNNVQIAEFQNLRGVMATKAIKKGEEIISIPAKCAVDLGSQSEDPVPAAMQMLAAREADAQTPRKIYWQLIPPPDSSDLCTPDFFSEQELQMLRWPPLVVQVRRRSAAIRQALGAAAPSGDTPIEQLGVAGGAMRELRWAVWAVQSRVLTVLGPDQEGHKLLIPFIDMFNHRASSPHYLTGRSDGSLRVVAGEEISVGEQIFIVYGTESTNNSDFLGHYGFVDASARDADVALLRAYPEAATALDFVCEEEEGVVRDKSELALQFRGALLKARAKMKRDESLA